MRRLFRFERQPAINGSVAASKNHATRDLRGPSPLVAIREELAPRPIVDPPLAEPLGSRRIFIQYRMENLRVMPVFGSEALEVSLKISTRSPNGGRCAVAFHRRVRRNGSRCGACARASPDTRRIGRPDPPRDRQPNSSVHDTGVRSAKEPDVHPIPLSCRMRRSMSQFSELKLKKIKDGYS